MKFTETQLLKALNCTQISADQTRRFIVAYSGGLDSHVLLAAMSALRGQLGGIAVSALHIHHGVNPAADEWVAHCIQVCRSLAIPRVIKKIQADQTKASLENTLREARYQAFSESLSEHDVLLLAHHADDQAETILLRLLRGAGAQGISGMPQQRALGKGHLLRPLLGYTKQQLERYAVAKQLSWIEDDSNADVQFDRNFLRQRVMPLIAERWPSFGHSLTRHARINRQLQRSMDFFLARELQQLMTEKGVLKIPPLLEYSQEVQLNLLRAWIASLTLPAPSYKQLWQILSDVMLAREDAQPQVNWPGAIVRRYQDGLHASSPPPEFDAKRVYEWHPETTLNISGVGELKLEKMVGAGLLKMSPNSYSVRFRQGGERCQPAGRQGSHPLKKLLQEYHVPPWLRDRTPLIYCGEQLAAVGDIWVCEGFATSDDEQGFRVLLTP
ncbi:MAG: tRNA lysidine(34) synthetase TilS [Pseudomonadales bacterium]|nr:tRNA lysidine(34) synthetase TilS [Pseudomonadales bacterium]